jgi:hypothetical protein
MNHLNYTAMFRGFATKNKAIQHKEGEKMHFVRMIRSGGPFPTLDLKEFLDSKKFKLNYPALVLESYDATYQDNLSDNIKKTPLGGFIILDSAGKADGFDVIDALLDKTEAIGEQIIAALRYTFAENNKLFDVNSVSSERVDLPALQLYGTRFNFSLPETATPAFTYNPDNWIE